MASHVAVAVQLHPDAFLDRFDARPDPDEDGLLTVGSTLVRCGLDFVLVHTQHPPSVTLDAALAEVERVLPGLVERRGAVAVGLGGGAPSTATPFAEWTAHWIRGVTLLHGELTVARAMFSRVVESGLSGSDLGFVPVPPRDP